MALDVVADASPELLAGEGALDRPVRWVLPQALHFVRAGETPFREVYEGAGFLDGGELLLTNGFAFLGADAGALRLYVRELAARGVAGLAVEVGRSLERMPVEVVSTARELGFPLVALRRVVPFVRIAEAANRAIVTHGLAARSVPAARAVDHGAALLADLADGQPLNQPEVAARSGLAGFRPGPGSRLVGVSVHGPRAVALAAVDRVAGRCALRAAFPGDVLALLVPPPGRDAVRAVRDAFLAVTEPSSPRLTVAVGHAVGADDGWLRWSDTLRAARTTLELALTVPAAEPAYGDGPLITSARALALERELTRGGVEANRERLARIVDHVLGPLLDWEALHGSDLVRTLEIHLRHGCSPTRTAALLHIGRQSLYQRLDRIESLLGVEVGDPELLGELLGAACAARVVGAGAAHGSSERQILSGRTRAA
nr:PucR family transcriptional regulator [Streptomyces sp. SID8379]